MTMKTMYDVRFATIIIPADQFSHYRECMAIESYGGEGYAGGLITTYSSYSDAVSELSNYQCSVKPFKDMGRLFIKVTEYYIERYDMTHIKGRNYFDNYLVTDLADMDCENNLYMFSHADCEISIKNMNSYPAYYVV